MSISMLPETRWSRCPRHTNQWTRPASHSKAGVSQRSARCAGVRTRSLAGQRYGRYRQMSDAPVFVQLDEGSNDLWRLDEIADIIKYGGVGIVPTDSFPALVCDMCNKAAVDKLYYLRHLQHSKPLSILCRSFADINKYTLGFPTSNVPGQKDTFRLVKELLPGPYTFILHASKELPKLVLSSPPQIKSKTRRTVGIRMPDQPVCQALLQRVDAPLVVTSAHVAADELNFEVPDAAHLMDMYPGVDFVIDIGPHLAQGSSVVDMTGPTPVIVRRGLGDVSAFE